MTIIEDLNPSYSWGSERLIFKFSLTSILFQFLLPNRLKLKDGTQTEIFSSLPPLWKVSTSVSSSLIWEYFLSFTWKSVVMYLGWR